jgi:hypothetical protein
MKRIPYFIMALTGLTLIAFFLWFPAYFVTRGQSCLLDESAMGQVHGMTGCPAVALGAGPDACQSGGSDCDNGLYPTCGTCTSACPSENSLANGTGNTDAEGYFGSGGCTNTYNVQQCTAWQIEDPDPEGPTQGCSCEGPVLSTPKCSGKKTILNGC